MADRAHYRGGRGGGGHARGARGGRGGGRGGHGADSGASGGGASQERERPKKENILDLSKYVDKRITVKFNGGREGKSSQIFPIFPPLSCIVRSRAGLHDGCHVDLGSNGPRLTLTSVYSHWHTKGLRRAYELGS